MEGEKQWKWTDDINMQGTDADWKILNTEV